MKNVSMHYSGRDELYHITVDRESIYACKSRAEAILFAEELKCIYEKHDLGVSEMFKKRQFTFDEITEQALERQQYTSEWRMQNHG